MVARFLTEMSEYLLTSEITKFMFTRGYAFYLLDFNTNTNEYEFTSKNTNIKFVVASLDNVFPSKKLKLSLLDVDKELFTREYDLDTTVGVSGNTSFINSEGAYSKLFKLMLSDIKMLNLIKPLTQDTIKDKDTYVFDFLSKSVFSNIFDSFTKEGKLGYSCMLYVLGLDNIYVVHNENGQYKLKSRNTLQSVVQETDIVEFCKKVQDYLFRTYCSTVDSLELFARAIVSRIPNGDSIDLAINRDSRMISIGRFAQLHCSGSRIIYNDGCLESLNHAGADKMVLDFRKTDNFNSFISVCATEYVENIKIFEEIYKDMPTLQNGVAKNLSGLSNYKLNKLIEADKKSVPLVKKLDKVKTLSDDVLNIRVKRFKDSIDATDWVETDVENNNNNLGLEIIGVSADSLAEFKKKYLDSHITPFMKDTLDSKDLQDVHIYNNYMTLVYRNLPYKLKIYKDKSGKFSVEGASLVTSTIRYEFNNIDLLYCSLVSIHNELKFRGDLSGESLRAKLENTLKISGVKADMGSLDIKSLRNQVIKAYPLMFNGSLVGYRFQSPMGYFDISLKAVKTYWGMSIITNSERKVINLKQVGNNLVSDNEETSGDYIWDVSDNSVLCTRLFAIFNQNK